MASPGLLKVDHVAIASWSISEMLPLYRDIMGGEFIEGGDSPGHGIRTIQLQYPGGFKFELMEPLPGESKLAAHLDKRGPGFHHVTVYMEDLDNMLTSLQETQTRVVGIDRSCPEWQEAYVHPGDNSGALLQLVETDREWVLDIGGLDDVLAGRILWDGCGYSLRE